MKHHGTIIGRAVLISVLAISAALTGCAKEKEKPIETETVQTSSAAEPTGSQEIPNPMEEVENELAFEKIGVHMVLPKEAEEPSCLIINNEVADVQFTCGDAVYSYRASDTAQDFAGIFERFSDDIIGVSCGSGEQETELQIKTTESGGRMAVWEWGSTKYTLYTASPMTDEDMIALSTKLAELSENEK